MARSLYAGRPGDSVVSLFDIGDRKLLALPADQDGNPAAVPLTVWDEPDGTQLTNLLAADGTTPITTVVVPAAARGQIPEFYGPDGYNVSVYLRDPDGDYQRLDARADDAAAVALQAAADAEAAKEAAEQVGATNDTIMASRQLDPGSAFVAAQVEALQDPTHPVHIQNTASTAEGLAGTEYVPGMPLDQAAVVRMVATIAQREGLVFLESYPREGTEATDDARLDRALADMITRGAKTLVCGPTAYAFTAGHELSIDQLVVQGVRQATILNINANVTAFNVTGDYTVFRDLRIECTTLARTVFPVVFNDVLKGAAERCYFRGLDGSRFAGVYFKAVTSGSSMGLIDACIFSHACIRVETWDVVIRHTYVWAMSCDYGIGVFNGAGNGFLDQVSIVPPLKSNPNGIAGLYFDSPSGHAGTWDGSIYLDGNSTLSVRQGLYIGPNWFNIDLTVKANKMDSDCVVIDSAYNIDIDYHGENNNVAGDGSVDIRVKQTGAQPVEKVRISGQCLQTAAVAGTAGPAVKVESTVTDINAVRVEVDVKQPSGGGGYSNPEIDVPVSGGYPTQRLGASRGQLSAYRVVGSVACASGDTGKTITLGSPRAMAYRPRPSQITLAMESAGQTLPAYRITYTTDNQIFVAFASALTAAGTLHWRAHLD